MKEADNTGENCLDKILKRDLSKKNCAAIEEIIIGAVIRGAKVKVESALEFVGECDEISSRLFSAVFECASLERNMRAVFSSVAQRKLALQNVVEMFGTLLEKGSDNSLNKENAPSEEDREKVWKLFLESGFTLEGRDRKGVPVMHYAADKKYFNLLRALLRRGLSADIIDENENTVLDLILISGLHKHGDIVKTLVEKNVHFKHKNFVEAFKRDEFSSEVISLLWDKYTEENLNFFSLDEINSPQEGSKLRINYQYVKLALKKGTDPDAVNTKGDTLLINVVRNLPDDLNIMETLLEHGANPNLFNNAGESALSVLCKSPVSSRSNFILRFSCLTRNGANPNLRNPEGRSVWGVFYSSNIQLYKRNSEWLEAPREEIPYLIENQGTQFLNAFILGGYIHVKYLLACIGTFPQFKEDLLKGTVRYLEEDMPQYNELVQLFPQVNQLLDERKSSSVWNTRNHFFFPEPVREMVETVMLCFKRFNLVNKTFFPKPLIYILIRLALQKN